MQEIFAAIGQFSTSNLKKVSDDMKTKNQKKDGPSIVPAVQAKRESVSAGRRAGKGPKGPPIKELQKDTNWVLENWEGVHDLTVEDAQMQHLVCLMNCKNITLRLSGKVKSINVDGCLRANIICADVISAVELVNCERCAVQTTGKVNAFAIDKCDGVNLWLSKESLEAEITTSKSSEMNVTIPEEGGEEGDTVEIPIPEQFVTKVVGPKKLRTEVSSLYSG